MRILLIILSVLLVPLFGNAFATMNDEVYGPIVFDAKSSYWDIIKKLDDGIKLSEKSLSGTIFVSDSAKKIESAWNINGDAVVSLEKAKEEMHVVDSYLNQGYYESAYYEMAKVDSIIYDIENDLITINKEIKNAEKIELDYQEAKKFCFLFWCEEVKQYPQLEQKLQDTELKISETVDKKNNLKIFYKQAEMNQKSYQAQLDKNQLQDEMNQKSYEAQQEQQQLQEEINQKQYESDMQEQLRIQQQYEAQKQLKQQQYEAQQEQQRLIEQQTLDDERNQIRLTAKSYPVIKGYINGELTYYVNPLPSYVSQNVHTQVEALSSWMDGKYINGVLLKRTYSSENRDFSINWVKDYQEDAIGRQVGSHLIVGLGSSHCFDSWKPFDGQTVYRIMLHEVGHAMGQDHNEDFNNIMYKGGTGTRYEYDYSDTVTLNGGETRAIQFCHDGNVSFTTEAVNPSSGYKVYVIPSDTNSYEVIDLGYPFNYVCSSYQNAVRSFSSDCNVTRGSSLILHNPSLPDVKNTVMIKIKIIDNNPAKDTDYSFDPDSRYFSQEQLNHVASLFRGN